MSFEFFPPKSEEMEKNLWNTIKELEPLKPEFVSVTYGAGGSTRERTHNTVKKIKEHTSLEPAAHLTCVGSTKEEVNQIARDYWDVGVKHIVALRGDPPEGLNNYKPNPDGYEYAVDLVKGLKELADFEISVAAFPEMHPESNNFDKDLDILKMKVDAGATRAITQYFLEPETYLEYKNKVVQKNIDIILEPGIIVISNFAQFLKFSKLCQAKIPEWLKNLLSDLDDTPQTRDMVAVSITGELCKSLRQEGENNFHFYTLNRPHQTRAICRLLGLEN